MGGLQHRQNKRSADKRRHKEASEKRRFISAERKLQSVDLRVVSLFTDKR